MIQNINKVAAAMVESIIAEFIGMIRKVTPGRALALLLLATALALPAACSATSPVEPGGPAAQSDPADTDLATLEAPTLTALALDGRPLRVLATTSLVGDAVARVGGEAIDLTTLMGPGQDPHSYQPAAADLTAAADADVIFVNGWGLEEGLLDDLATISEGTPIVPVSAGITPREYGGDSHEGEEGSDHAAEGSDHGPADPHVWQSVGNVERWVETVRAALSALDPANAATYAANAEAYTAELKALDGEVRSDLSAIPDEKRVLVTNHETLGYFADDYGFAVLGTVVPSASTTGEPTAQGLAALVSAMKLANVCSVFIETTATDQLARTLGEELTGCADVHVLTLYTDALGAPGSGADSYPGMMLANAATLVEGLR